MIQKTTDEITLIIYDSPSPPRCLKINKKILKFILGLASILFMLTALSAIFIAPYIKTLKNQFKDSPETVDKLERLEQEVIVLKGQNLNLAKMNESFKAQENKGNKEESTVAAPVAVSTKIPEQPKKIIPKPENLLSFFKMPPGFQNLISDNMAKIQRVNFRLKKDHTVFRFNLANGKQLNKLRGYIFVAQFSGEQMKMYPNIDTTQKDLSIKYDIGESFTVSRFRPTIAMFDKPADNQKLFYKILVFSRTGDLLIEEVHGPFNLE